MNFARVLYIIAILMSIWYDLNGKTDLSTMQRLTVQM